MNDYILKGCQTEESVTAVTKPQPVLVPSASESDILSQPLVLHLNTEGTIVRYALTCKVLLFPLCESIGMTCHNVLTKRGGRRGLSGGSHRRPGDQTRILADTKGQESFPEPIQVYWVCNHTYPTQTLLHFVQRIDSMHRVWGFVGVAFDISGRCQVVPLASRWDKMSLCDELGWKRVGGDL